jgi:hypothetical protein
MKRSVRGVKAFRGANAAERRHASDLFDRPIGRMFLDGLTRRIGVKEEAEGYCLKIYDVLYDTHSESIVHLTMGEAVGFEI